MKAIKTITAIAVLFTAFLTNAQNVITVSNNPDSPGQYTNLQEAIDVTADGDTIYVSGSNTTYGDITINKQLSLLGAGYHPNNQYELKSQIDNINLTLVEDMVGNIISSSSGTMICGFEIYNIETEAIIDDVIINRNNIGPGTSVYLSYGAGNGWQIKNNIIRGWIICGASNDINILFSNNVFTTNALEGFSSSSVIVDNNIFLSPNSYVNAFSNCSFLQVLNNIFFNTRTDGLSYGTFQNNISYGGDYTEFDYGSNTAIDNIVNTNPQFVDVPEFDYSYDYHLQVGSPCIGAGSDGTDIGIYGGTNPFPLGGEVPFQTSPTPAIPQVVEVNVQTPVVAPGGVLKVNVKARIQD